jgi:hypothetical protein
MSHVPSAFASVPVAEGVPARGFPIDPAIQPTRAGGPLNPEHLRALSEGRLRAKKIKRAVGVAMFSGWTMAAFAVMTLLFALTGDVAGLLTGTALGAIAFNELRGAGKIKRYDASGAMLLACNQVALGVLICAYSAWSMWSAMHNPQLQAALNSVGGSTGDPQMDAMLSSMTNMVTYGVYGTMFVVGIIVPGLTALYYYSRGRHVREFVANTPSWVVDAMRATG